MFDWQIAGVRTFQNLIHVGSSALKEVEIAGTISHQAAGLCESRFVVQGRQPVLYCQLRQAYLQGIQPRRGQYEESVGTVFRYCRERAVELIAFLHPYDMQLDTQPPGGGLNTL